MHRHAQVIRIRVVCLIIKIAVSVSSEELFVPTCFS